METRSRLVDWTGVVFHPVGCVAQKVKERLREKVWRYADDS